MARAMVAPTDARLLAERRRGGRSNYSNLKLFVVVFASVFTLGQIYNAWTIRSRHAAEELSSSLQQIDLMFLTPP